jgi:hypothetical protein
MQPLGQVLYGLAHGCSIPDHWVRQGDLHMQARDCGHSMQEKNAWKCSELREVVCPPHTILARFPTAAISCDRQPAILFLVHNE